MLGRNPRRSATANKDDRCGDADFSRVLNAGNQPIGHAARFGHGEKLRVTVLEQNVSAAAAVTRESLPRQVGVRGVRQKRRSGRRRGGAPAVCRLVTPRAGPAASHLDRRFRGQRFRRFRLQARATE